MKSATKPQRAKLDESVFEALPVGWPSWVHPLTLASSMCVFCRGCGIRKTPVAGIPKVCGCVYRSVFRACFARWLTEMRNHRGSACIEVGKGGFACTRPSAEYVADFESISLKAARTDLQRNILELHFLTGHDYKFCHAQALKIDPALTYGQWWHQMYMMQENIGFRLATVQPYRLFPLDEYFGINTTKVYWKRNTKGSGMHSTTLQHQPLHLPFNGIRYSKKQRAEARDESNNNRSLPLAA